MPTSVLFYSKLIAPSTNSAWITRERLLDLLDTGKTNRLTIVRAPAGYGKTTVLSQWTSRIKDQSAWVSLDHSDNDPIRFWKYISKAIGMVTQTDIYERLLPLFITQPRISIELFVDLICSEISNHTKSIQLILNDSQVVTHSVIHRSIARLVDNSPKNFRLILASRSELPLPLFRWKDNSYVQEISLNEIKFTYKETALYLKEKPLPSYDLNTLHEIHKKTEGWPAGIQLAANIFKKEMLAYTNSNKFSGKDPYVSDYLFHELLATFTTEQTEFLLQTSVLKYLVLNFVMR